MTNCKKLELEWIPNAYATNGNVAVKREIKEEREDKYLIVRSKSKNGKKVP